MAYQTYIEPITRDTIKNIIRIEKVDAVLSTMGGQTALNICIELEEEGFLEKMGVDLLGANVETIKKTEDRDLFAKELDKLGYQTGRRFRATSPEHAIELANADVSYPLIIRRDFALGGKGAALIYNDEQLNEPIRNGVIICSIENVDPCGIHTGDSITVAPAQTISDACYQQLRSISLHVAKHMGVVAGGANVQFAINPDDENDIVVIEMNPRVSRSSALASKATGYPIAKISALLAVGYTLKEILNDITKASPVAFEPTLDYVALKIPTFPFNKFPTSSKNLGPQMRSVGEILSLGGNFNEAFLKALRSLEMGLEIPSLSQLKNTPLTIEANYTKERLAQPQELSLLTALEALRCGVSKDEVFQLSKISPWFIDQIQEIVEAEKWLKENRGEIEKPETLRVYKQLGLSDKALAKLCERPQRDLLALRFEHKVFPIYKAVDTCSGEFNAQTPYYYSTYSTFNEAIPLSLEHRSVAIMGSGPNRIGQGIEFDYSCVKSCQRLREKNIKAIMINSNPETVSTDYDSSDRLYLSALYSEDLFDILYHENPESIIASFSGQTGIQVRGHIEKSFRNEFKKFNFLGPTLEILDLTEDRKQFGEVLKKVDLSRTRTIEARGHKELMNAMLEIGLPVIVRPSYVIGGESMYIFNSFEDIHQLPETLKDLLKSSNVALQVENYLEAAIEYDVDLIRDQSGNSAFAICEHIEYAGVHSGDSGMISPPVVLTKKMYERVKNVSIDLANKLEIIGPINIQFAVKNGEIYCIEANPRGSRTLPFLSKAYNFSLPSLATDAMLGEEIENWDQMNTDHFCVKQSTFPFDRFIKDNIILGPKMRSTGETMGIDKDKERAILKSYLGNYPKLDQVGKILISLADNNKEILLPYLKSLSQKGHQFIATSGTCQFIQQQGLKCEPVAKIDQDEGVTIVEALKDESIVMVFNTPMNQGHSKTDGEIIRNTAIQYGIPCFTRPENITAVMACLTGSGAGHDNPILPVSLQRAHQ
jgi:carbamoyl-phosphate synthase large subunit